MGIWKTIKSLTAGYDAVQGNSSSVGSGGADKPQAGSSRRRAVRIDNRRDDAILKGRSRDQLTSDSRNLKRNASEVAWMIRRHLDYVATFSFRSRTGNTELDDRIQDLMDWWQRPFNCDASGRFNLSQLIRMGESLRTVDGDCLFLKLTSGKVQLIEGDRVRTPGAGELGDNDVVIKPNEWVQGVKVDSACKPSAYAICDHADSGNGYGYVLRKIVPASNVLHHAYYDRYEQIRGISPLASAINAFTDLYEAREYALSKMKLSQIFALKIKRDSIAGLDSDPANPLPITFDFGKGSQVLDLDPGDDASFMESGTPSNEFQTFYQTGMSIGLKALDIPFSFYDEAYSTYSGSRQAMVLYEKSSDAKREENRRILNALTIWRMTMFIANGDLVLPDGMNVSDLKFEWIAAGLPWVDPQKQTNADVLAVNNYMTSRQRVAKAQGLDFFDIADEQKEEQDYLLKMGLPLTAPITTIVQPPDEEEQAKPIAKGKGTQ